MVGVDAQQVGQIGRRKRAKLCRTLPPLTCLLDHVGVVVATCVNTVELVFGGGRLSRFLDEPQPRAFEQRRGESAPRRPMVQQETLVVGQIRSRYRAKRCGSPGLDGEGEVQHNRAWAQRRSFTWMLSGKYAPCVGLTAAGRSMAIPFQAACMFSHPVRERVVLGTSRKSAGIKTCTHRQAGLRRLTAACADAPAGSATMVMRSFGRVAAGR